MGDRRLYGYLFLLEVLSFPLIFRGCGVFSLNPGEHCCGNGAPPASFKRSPQEIPFESRIKIDRSSIWRSPSHWQMIFNLTKIAHPIQAS
jgi:hypothetical protein